MTYRVEDPTTGEILETFDTFTGGHTGLGHDVLDCQR